MAKWEQLRVPVLPKRHWLHQVHAHQAAPLQQACRPSGATAAPCLHAPAAKGGHQPLAAALQHGVSALRSTHPLPQGDLRVVIFSTRVGMRTGPLTCAQNMAGTHVGQVLFGLASFWPRFAAAAADVAVGGHKTQQQAAPQGLPCRAGARPTPAAAARCCGCWWGTAQSCF